MNSLTPVPKASVEVCITEQLRARVLPAPDYRTENRALQRLAAEMAEHPNDTLPRLVKLAMELCEAQSGGISVLEPEQAQFRWLALSGVLARFEGATTPRSHSPCGVCLDRLEPTLMEHPERVYEWIADADIAVPEVLLVPLQIRSEAPMGTLWLVARDRGHFHGEHARIITELAAFAGSTLRLLQGEERLKAALTQQEILTREMNHRVKNIFALFDGMVHMTARSTKTTQAMEEALSGRLKALASAHDLVRRMPEEETLEETTLRELVQTILEPHSGAYRITGPLVTLGRYATTDLALVLHELATNASKYGALHDGVGTVAVEWAVHDKAMHLFWSETGGARIEAPPSAKGFGTRLAQLSLSGRLGGRIDYDWDPAGLKVAIVIPADRLTG
jgi:two-component sensor histidine kinase